MQKTLTLLCAAILALTGCASDEKKPKRLCPQTAIVRELERVKDFGGETPDDGKNLVAAALMRKVSGRCEYRDDGVDVNFDLKMAAAKGPRLGGERVSFPFFTAVADPEQKILAKELMTVEFSFDGKDKGTEKTESLHVFIPMDKDADGTNHQVLMGFQLTEDQIKEIRKESAETPPAGSQPPKP